MCRKNSDQIHVIFSPSLWLQCAVLCLHGSLELGCSWTAHQCKSPQVMNFAKFKCFYIFRQLWADPRGVAYRRLFNFCPFVSLFVCPSPIRSVLSYSANISQTPNIITDSRPRIKWLLGGHIRGAPNPPNPHYWGPKYVLGGYHWWTMLITIESTFFVKLLTSNIPWAILGKSPDPQYPLPPSPCQCHCLSDMLGSRQ